MGKINRRDYFAGVALQGIMSSLTWASSIASKEKAKGNVDWEIAMVKDCVTVADAMIKVLDEVPAAPAKVCQHRWGYGEDEDGKEDFDSLICFDCGFTKDVCEHFLIQDDFNLKKCMKCGKVM